MAWRDRVHVPFTAVCLSPRCAQATRRHPQPLDVAVLRQAHVLVLSGLAAPGLSLVQQPQQQQAGAAAGSAGAAGVAAAVPGPLSAPASEMLVKVCSRVVCGFF